LLRVHDLLCRRRHDDPYHLPMANAPLVTAELGLADPVRQPMQVSA
jgi:hypothetical protein